MVNGNLGPSQARAEDYIAAGNDLAKAKTVLILLPQNPSLDAAAAALALYLSVSKVQKTVNIACANPLTVAFNRLYAVNKVKQEIGNKNLLISFDCPEESLEKVSYNIENNTFNLVVEKKSGYPALQTKDLKYNYTGVSADIVFILGASKIEDLGVLYQEENAFFANTQVVNISNSPAGGLFGKLNIFNTQASSVSELTALFIKKNELPIEQDLSTNLVAGMEASTNNMAFKTSADTFEIMAWLMKNGGRRNHLGQFTPHQANLNKMPVNWGAQAPFAAQMSQSNPVNNANNGNIYGKNPTLNQGNNLFYKQPKVEEPFGTEPDKEGDSAIPKPDWFKPKIFKGKTKV